MNVYKFIKEASITDYIDSDSLYQVLKDCPVTSNLELVECYDDMTIKMKGDLGFQFFKIVNGPKGLEAYKIAEKSGEKLGDTFPLTSEMNETESRLEKLKQVDLDEGCLKESIDDTSLNSGIKFYVIGAKDFQDLIDSNGGAFEDGYLEITQKEADELAKKQGFFASNIGFGTEGNITDSETTKKDSSEDKYVVWQFGGMISDPHDLEDKIFNSKEEATNALKTWKDSYGSNKSYYKPSGNVYKYRGKTPKESREAQSKDVASTKESNLTEGANLRGSVYTEIVRSIADACSEEMDTEEIRKFLQDLMGYIRGTAESYDVMVESANLNEADLLSYLTEAPNPENADANELIKSSLKDALFAYNHRDELKELGIDVDYKVWSDHTEEEPSMIDDFASCYLVGKNGRKLSCNTSRWEVGSMPASRDLNRTSGDYYDYVDEDTFAKKSYKDSREVIKNAKSELPTLKRRLKLYERRYGKDSSQYRLLLRDIHKIEETISKGIKAHKQTDYGQTPDENVDYKNYLDSKKIKDREKPYEAPRMNPTLAAFKGAKSDEEYEAHEEERNRKQDEEDAQRIADMAKRAAEEKSRRDAYLAKSRERTQATLKEIRDRIAASKERVAAAEKERSGNK